MLPSPAIDSPHRLPLLDGDWTLTALGVDNLRALRMSEPLALRRLLLIVGRNGAGKSTLARVFPLLRQSVGSHAREPLLWWDKDQIDFGSFADALRRGADEMTFSFEFRGRNAPPWRVSSTVCAAEGGSRVARVRYEEYTNALILSFDATGALEAADGRFEVGGVSSSITSVDLPSRIRHQASGLSAISAPWDRDVIGSSLLRDGIPREVIREALKRSLWYHPDFDATFERHLAIDLAHHARQHDRPELSALAKRWRLSASLSHEIRQRLFCDHALWRLSRAEQLIADLARRTAYLGPFRAVPERTYRPQSVAVETLDPRGANLAMFIAALTDDERRDLNDFLAKSLQFEVSVETSRAQYELKIQLDGQRYNLLDVGFGYSQVLPVALQIWAGGRVLTHSRLRQPLAAIVIEQPELHLHPHHQTLVARVLAASAMEAEGPMQVIETHSDYIVSEIGLLVARGALSTDRVAVLCVEPTEAGDAAGVRVATFDADGILHNWPAGFLSP